MRKSAAICLICLLSCTSLFGQEAIRTGQGTDSGYASRDATVLSMMGWGICLALGIALLCGSLHQNTN